MLLVARPRLHLALADMGHASARAFGGIGLSIDRPQTVLEFEKSSSIELHGLDVLDDEGQDDINKVIDRLRSSLGDFGFRVFLKSVPPQHVGFGSKTSLLLGLVAGINALAERNWSSPEMQRLSGRGGASGVGIHAFFTGGVVWDGGHATRSARELRPSGSMVALDLPPLMMRFPFPEAWRIVLALPAETPMTGEQEEQFFATNAPIPHVEALSTMAILYHGVLPSMSVVDYGGLTSALGELHRIGFKRRELHRWSAETKCCVQTLLRNGFAAGMSSVGPLIYVIIPKDDESVLRRVESICSTLDLEMFDVAEAWNSGYELRFGSKS
jgi:beta-ribofuranosylaminobenzene 5'-phosphate synthase